MPSGVEIDTVSDGVPVVGSCDGHVVAPFPATLNLRLAQTAPKADQKLRAGSGGIIRGHQTV